MLLKFLSALARIPPIAFVVLLCILALDGVASGQRPGLKKDELPRVGLIKDYPATGLMTGCGNLYFYLTSRANTSADDYVFLARGDGSDAWMNLNGRDVRLRQVKSSRQSRQFFYRSGTTNIRVVFENFKPENEPITDGDSMFKMRIILQRGRTIRIVRAVGDSDC